MRSLDELRKSAAYHAASAKADFVEEVSTLMNNMGMKQRDLAEAMGVPASQVSRMLRGDQNVTLETMVMVAAALDRTLRIHLARRGVVVSWLETPPQQQAVRSAETQDWNADSLAGRPRLTLSAAYSGG